MRSLTIASPDLTSCKNWHSRKPTPDGPVFSSTYNEGECRVPWLSRDAPKTGIRAHCGTCGVISENGIGITVGAERFEFCGPPHYVEWRRLRLTERMRKCAEFGEKAYSEMYETRAPAGSYSNAKDCFAEAASLACELEMPEEELQFRNRLQHIKDVFRSQF